MTFTPQVVRVFGHKLGLRVLKVALPIKPRYQDDQREMQRRPGKDLPAATSHVATED